MVAKKKLKTSKFSNNEYVESNYTIGLSRKNVMKDMDK